MEENTEIQTLMKINIYIYLFLSKFQQWVGSEYENDQNIFSCTNFLVICCKICLLKEILIPV